MSFDSPDANARWHAKKGFTFELWTDDDQRTLARHFGAADSTSDGHASRVTVLLDDQGRTLVEYAVGLDLGTHPDAVLQDVKLLFGDP